MSPSVGTRQAATNALRIVHLCGHFIKVFRSFARSKNARFSGQRHLATLLILTVIAQGPVF